MPEEKEILFAMGSVFRLNTVEKLGSVWVLTLEPSGDHNQKYKELLNFFRTEINVKEIPPLLILDEFCGKWESLIAPITIIG